MLAYTNPNLTISYPVLYKAVSLYDWPLFPYPEKGIYEPIQIQGKAYQSQRYVPLSPFVFSIEMNEKII